MGIKNILVFSLCVLSLPTQALKNSDSAKTSRSSILNFEMKNHLGQKVRLESYKDKFLLVFFGFSHCKGSCPIAFQNMKASLNELGDLKADIKALLITVDPRRDTQERLASFVKRYNMDFEGLRAPYAEVEEVYNFYRNNYKKSPLAKHSKKNYLMDHSTTVYIMGKNGEFLADYDSGQNPRLAAKIIRSKIAAYKN